MTTYQSAELHRGMVVGLNGLRAVVRDVNHRLVHLHWNEELPRRMHVDCEGTGRLVTITDGKPSVVGCRACRSTGYLPAQTVSRRKWVAIEELTVAPPRESADPAMVATAAELMRGPR